MNFGNKVDPAELAKLPPAQKAQVEMMEKLKGSITDTFKNIETNITLNPENFGKTLAVNPPAQNRQNKPKKPRGPGAQAKTQPPP
jgi:hypothetical protein